MRDCSYEAIEETDLELIIKNVRPKVLRVPLDRLRFVQRWLAHHNITNIEVRVNNRMYSQTPDDLIPEALKARYGDKVPVEKLRNLKRE